jgi:hypothetical protein
LDYALYRLKEYHCAENRTKQSKPNQSSLITS